MLRVRKFFLALLVALLFGGGIAGTAAAAQPEAVGPSTQAPSGPTAETTSWRPGDAIVYQRGCNSLESIRTIIDTVERSGDARAARVSDCFIVRGALAAHLVARVTRSVRLRDGPDISAWEIHDALGETVWVLLPDRAGPHRALSAL